jgi:hypothetical protein
MAGVSTLSFFFAESLISSESHFLGYHQHIHELMDRGLSSGNNYPHPEIGYQQHIHESMDRGCIVLNL